MSAPLGNKNAKGNMGGVTLRQKELSRDVRDLGLRAIKKVLENPDVDKDLFKAVLIRLAGTLLPRINEHMGENGEPINLNVINYGSNYSFPIPAQGISVAVPESEAEIQDSGLAQEGGEIKDGIKRPDNKDTA